MPQLLTCPNNHHWDLTDDPVDLLVGFSNEVAGAAMARYLAGKGFRAECPGPLGYLDRAVVFAVQEAPRPPGGWGLSEVWSIAELEDERGAAPDPAV